MGAKITRRALLAGGAALLARPRTLSASNEGRELFAAAYKERTGGYGVAILAGDGDIVSRLPLPDRGHDITCDPACGRFVAFARRPGLFAVVFDRRGRRAPVTIAAAKGRHFFGHGVFSSDGKLLYATENDFDRASGMIGVYDASDGFKRLGEFPTHGMDPHELLLMPDGKTLAVANGGIETHPDFGRAKLNLATMEPSLVFIDSEHGDLVEKHGLPAALHRLSIRHMAIDAAGRCWFGCQFEGPQSATPPLLGHVAQGNGVTLIEIPEDTLRSMRNYVGSVAYNAKENMIAISSPRGNRMAVVDAGTAALRHVESLTEVCGLASHGEGFVASTGDGAIVFASGAHKRYDDLVWDNHILHIG